MKNKAPFHASVIFFSLLTLLVTSCTCSKKKMLGSEEEAYGNMKSEDILPGTGAEATPGKKVSLLYTAWLSNGSKVDAVTDKSKPRIFTLGKEEVIKGWERGVLGMKEGGKRKITIPSDLAYGEKGLGSKIPPFSTLIIEMELLKVE